MIDQVPSPFRCATCGGKAIGTFDDGSPRFGVDHLHEPIWPGMPVHPDHIPWVRHQVTLTEAELERARQHAVDTETAGQREGFSMAFKPLGGESNLDVKARGYAAELAAARLTGLKLDWHVFGRGYRREDKAPDLGRRTEVRNARYANGRLWCQQRERRDWLYLLVTGEHDTFTIRGWLEGADLQVPEHWREPPDVRYPGYFANQAELHPLPLPDDA